MGVWASLFHPARSNRFIETKHRTRPGVVKVRSVLAIYSIPLVSRRMTRTGVATFWRPGAQVVTAMQAALPMSTASG